MEADISSEDLRRLCNVVGARLAELAGLPLERARMLAASVACCRVVDEDGMLVFSDEDEREVLRLPYARFADLLEEDEADEDELPPEPARSSPK